MISPIAPLYSGMVIHESELLTEQWRFPRTKKRRIRNKWAVRDENLRPARTAILMPDGSLVCHPQMAEAIRRSLHDKPLQTVV